MILITYFINPYYSHRQWLYYKKKASIVLIFPLQLNINGQLIRHINKI
jgi:uncharacterized membrane protein